MTTDVAHAVFGLLFENTTEIVLVLDRRDGCVLCANEPAAELLALGAAALVGQKFADLIGGRDLAAAGHYEEIELRRSDGYPVYVDLDVVHVDHPTHGALAALIARDTTERRTLQLELVAKHSALIAAHTELEQRNREIAKLAWRAAMGELVAGIAHHLNNPVAALSSTLRRVRKLAEALEPSQRVELDRLLERVARITTRIEFNVGEIVRASHAVSRGEDHALPPELARELSSFTEQLDSIPTKETP